MNIKKHPVYKALKNKIDNNGKMPSIINIHNLLTEIGVKHYFDGEAVNVVEGVSGQKKYVDYRYNGKVGKKIAFRATIKKGKKSPFRMFGDVSDSQWFSLDSSDSYYSMNSYRYAVNLIDMLDNYQNMTFQPR